MNRFNDLVTAISRYGSTHDDICRMVLGLSRDDIHEFVIIAPWWEPGIFRLPSRRIEFLGQKGSVRAWNVKGKDQTITYLKTGVGAPLVADVVLALGLSDCRRALFVGSVGALDMDICIGDIVIPEYSVCGDGVSRYLTGRKLAVSDTFGQKALPDRGLLRDLKRSAECICTQNRVRCHIGRTFSTDTIFAQFAHIEEIVNMGCNVIEMETAAAFRAAELAGIAMAALFSVSDNTLARKSLISGRTKQEMAYRKEVRSTIFPRVWEAVFGMGTAT